MPRYPGYSAPIAAMPAAVYSLLADRVAARGGESYPLHVGDTWMEAPEGCRMEDLRAADHPGTHRYAPVQGLPRLLDLLSERVTARTGLATPQAEILVTAGATGGLGAVIGATVSPGDEVLVLVPCWPLILGIVRSFHGEPVPVSILGLQTADDLRAAIEAKVTARTTALYINTPHNPTGKVFPKSWVEAAAEVARRHDLWLISDEVYDDYAFVGAHVPARPIAPERTFAAYSFSKAWGMAGNRCGYVVGPRDAIEQSRKVSTHTFYSAPTSAQLAAIRALTDARGDRWAKDAAASYAETGRKAAEILGLPAPEGGTFLFVDVSAHLDEGGLPAFLLRCADEEGLLLAPGTACGPFPGHVRLCYTSVAPDRALRGVEALRRVLAR